MYLFETFPAGYGMWPSAADLHKFLLSNLISYLPFILACVDTIVSLIKCFRERGVDMSELQNILHHPPRLFCTFQPRTICYVYQNAAPRLCGPPCFEPPLGRKFNVPPPLPLS